MTWLPPGSDKAVDAGCTCPREDNSFGRGKPYGSGGEMYFWMDADCPLHGVSADGR